MSFLHKYYILKLKFLVKIIIAIKAPFRHISHTAYFCMCSFILVVIPPLKQQWLFKQYRMKPEVSWIRKSFFIKRKQSWIKENSLIESPSKIQCCGDLRSHIKNDCLYLEMIVSDCCVTCGPMRERRPMHVEESEEAYQEDLINQSGWFPVLHVTLWSWGIHWQTYPRGHFMTGISQHSST